MGMLVGGVQHTAEMRPDLAIPSRNPFLVPTACLTMNTGRFEANRFVVFFTRVGHPVALCRRVRGGACTAQAPTPARSCHVCLSSIASFWPYLSAVLCAVSTQVEWIAPSGKR